MIKPFIFTAILVLTLGAVGFSSAPQLLNYQGRLTDSLGNPTNDTVSIVFSIYDNSTGGSSKWTETHANVIVKDGLFNVLLGSLIPVHDTVFSKGPNRWISITVDSDPEIAPRMRIASVGYAINADMVDGLSAAGSGEGLARKRQINLGLAGGVDTITYDHLQPFIVTLAEHHGSPDPDAVGYAHCIENDGTLTWLGVNGDGTQAAGRAFSNVVDTVLFVDGKNVVLETAGDGHTHRLIIRSTGHARVVLIYH